VKTRVIEVILLYFLIVKCYLILYACMSKVIIQLLWFVYAHVGPCGQEADVAHGADDERAIEGRERRCCQYDDPGARVSHSTRVGPMKTRARDDKVTRDREMEDLQKWFEVVLDGVPEDWWSHIHDESVLEQCIDGDPHWRSLVRHEALVGDSMTG
jgi:hypothetical protein